jgi:hypothetical protein
MGTFYDYNLLQLFHGLFNNYAAKAARGFINFVHLFAPNGDQTSALLAGRNGRREGSP